MKTIEQVREFIKKLDQEADYAHAKISNREEAGEIYGINCVCKKLLNFIDSEDKPWVN